jgi:hypothetical protein
MIGWNQIIQRRWKQRLLPARFTLNVGQEKCPRFRKGIFPSFACEKQLEFRNGLGEPGLFVVRCGAALRRADEAVCPHMVLAGATGRQARTPVALSPSVEAPPGVGRSFLTSRASDIFICFSKNRVQIARGKDIP